MMVDIGAGVPVVLIPGIQGRWEWMKPAVEALASRCRVITSSLPGEPDSDWGSQSGDGFDSFIAFVDSLLNRAQVQQAAICGVSYGSLIALRYAARRSERVRALAVVSALGPRWRPDRRACQYMRFPTLCGPLFFAGAIARAWPELCGTFPNLGKRVRFCARTIPLVLGAPAIPKRMARRAELAANETFEEDCRRISAPTLVVAGERHLDRMVGIDATLEYVSAIRGASFQILEKTGHLGIVTAPERFAAIISAFVNSAFVNGEGRSVTVEGRS